MESQKEFKQTEIGIIPGEWEVKELGEIAEINIGSRDPSKELLNNKFLYIDIYSIENETGIIKNAKEIIGKDAPSRARKVVHYNDVIMSTVRPYLKAFAIVPKKYDNQICSTGFAVFTCEEKLFPRYLLYTLFSKTVIDQCNRMMVGGQYPALSSTQVAKIKIPLPPLPEQQKIAEILGTVDEVIDKVDQAIEKTARLKKGLMQELLTKGIGHKEFKNTEIGRIPKEWQAVQLEEVIKDIKNGFPSGKRDENGIVQIRMNNVTTDGKVILNSYLKVPKPDNIENWLLESGDLLFNNTNSYKLVGKSAVFRKMPFPCTFSNHFTRIKFKENKANSIFILYRFLILWQKGYFKSVAIRHVGQSAVHNRYLLKLKIPLPPISEQLRIVEIVAAVDKRLESLEKKRKKFGIIKKGLMNDLLTGKRRVKGWDCHAPVGRSQ